MKKTSLRKNRFSPKRTTLPDNSPVQILGRRPRIPRPVGEDGLPGESRMEQLARNDEDIVDMLTHTLSTPVSPEAQAFYDRMFELTQGKKEKAEVTSDVSDAA